MDRQQRPYQANALEAALGGLKTVPSVLLVLATGLGKTVIFSLLAKYFVQFGRILVLAPRRKLVFQAAKAVTEWSGLPAEIEMGKSRCDPASLPPVVVASVASLNAKRLPRFSPTAFTLVVIDEAHHAVAATYRRILDYFRGYQLVGLTATPNRRDGQSLAQIFGLAPYCFGIEAGIRDGWLVPIRQMRVVVTSIDYSRVRATKYDLNEHDLERILVEERHLQAMAGPLLKHAGGRRTLVFAASVDHAHRLAAVLNRFRDGCARPVDGTTKDRLLEEAVEALRTGKVQFIVNCQLLIEGFDEASIECIAFCRPTRCRITFMQMLGRGLRLSAETGKRDLLVLDFVGVAGKHQFISALDILAGDLEPKVREAVERAAEGGADLLDALDMGRAEVARAEAAQRALDEQQRRGIVAEVKSHLIEVPTGLEAPAVAPPPPRVTDITPEQLVALRRYGIAESVIAGMDRAKATAQLAMRTARSLGTAPSAAEARILIDAGIDPRTMSARGAGKVVAAITKAGPKAAATRLGRRPTARIARSSGSSPRRRRPPTKRGRKNPTHPSEGR